jgi:hydroxymethylpyrimidine pyrophosphatase-like HAD family hydrolase
MIINDFTEADYFEGGFPAGELDTQKELYFAAYIFVPESEAGKIGKELDQIPGISYSLATAQRPGHRDIHITNKVATKEQAVAELRSRIGVEARDCYGFGDAMNDIHLFNAVGRKVAMGNATKELKARADEVIAPVSEDGLAAYLEGLK